MHWVFGQAAGVHARQCQLRAVQGHGVVGLVNGVFPKQGVVGIALEQPFAKQHQSGRFTVNPVQGHQIGLAGQSLELHQQALLHIRA